MKNIRILCIILAVAVVCVLAACGPRDGGGNPGGDDSALANRPGAENGAGDNSSQGESSSPGGDNASGGDGPGRVPDTGEDSPNPSDTPNTGGDAGSGDGGSGDGNADSGTSSPSPSNSPDSGSGGAEAGLAGAPGDILAKLISDLQEAGAEMPMSMPPMAAPEGGRQNAIGISEEDYGRYVIDDAQSIAGIGTFAHQIIIYQGVDDSAAAQIKRIVSGENGYDPSKWICVFPEKVVAVDAGSYVLLIASYRAVVDMAVEIFEETAGGTGEAITFWDGV